MAKASGQRTSALARACLYKLLKIAVSPIGPSRVFRFGLYEADASTGELRKNGRKVRIQEQPFQLLLMLLERPGQLVSRAEIRGRLWPADTFVDFDHSVNTAVNKLRDTLGDIAANPRFVETLARRGYRFIAPVVDSRGTEIGMNAASSPSAEQPSPAPEVTSAPTATFDEKPWSLSDGILTQPHEVPKPPRGLVRLLFLLIQLMYLSFYLVSLAKLGMVHVLIGEMVTRTTWAGVLLIITAAVGIPTRLYLISAVSFDYKGLGGKFQKLFAFIFPLDELWALAPFLLMHQIGFGLALASTAALLYLPFAQRSLMLMGYPHGLSHRG